LSIPSLSIIIQCLASLYTLNSPSPPVFSLSPVFSFSVFFFAIPPPPRSTLFPYTTLFRSDQGSDRSGAQRAGPRSGGGVRTSSLDRKSTRLNSSHVSISYAVFSLKKKKSFAFFYSIWQFLGL